MSEGQERVRELPDNSIVLLSQFTCNRAGNVFSHERSTAMIAEYCRVPMCSFWDSYLGNGILGGMLVSGYAHGENAGEIAFRILHGEKAKDIPVVKKSPNHYMFDYNQMKHFGVKLSQLPEDSSVINILSSLYSEHKGLIWTVTTGTLGLTLIILILLINILNRKKAERALRESKEWFGSIVETTPGFLLIEDAEANTIYTSMEQLLEFSCRELKKITKRKKWFWNSWNQQAGLKPFYL